MPFHSVSPESPAADIYHTHPRCRVAQRLEPNSRVDGTGAGRKECPFCFVLGQLHANKFVDMPGTPIPIGTPSVAAEFATTALGG